MIFSRSRIVLAALLGAAALPACAATTILFVGNSYTYGEGAGAPPIVKYYRPGIVHDLNGQSIGGVPALFKALTMEAGLDYDVSLETEPGAGLDFHYTKKYDTIVQPFDQVVLQSYSTLDAAAPGNPDKLAKYTSLLAQALHERNPHVRIYLDATWSRADQTYKPDGAWYGKPVTQMALDVRAGYDKAAGASGLVTAVVPVGEAWNRAIAAGLADANPYDGIDAGKINLWAPDNYHASPYGYYLEALAIFGSVTGRDPRSLGAGDQVARDIGIGAERAAALQAFAAAQLAGQPQ